MAYPIKPGDVVVLAVADYRYGTGRLYLRVNEIVEPVSFSDGDYLFVRGVDLYQDGTDRCQRSAYLRLSALSKAVRRR
ncbi:MAG TPA: hypothetical protein VK453_20335 [Micromonosporaceae bacterium]|nr:hypothetical protein [Micromonosporaceae bacterium]